MSTAPRSSMTSSSKRFLLLVLTAVLMAPVAPEVTPEAKTSRAQSCFKAYRQKNEARVGRIDGPDGGNGKSKMPRMGPFLQKENRDKIREKIRGQTSKNRKFEQVDSTCKTNKAAVKQSKAKTSCQGKGNGKYKNPNCAYLDLGGVTGTPCAEVDCRGACLDLALEEANNSTAAAARRMMLEGDDDEFEDQEEDTEEETDAFGYASDLLADKEWENLCDSMEEDSAQGKTDKYIDTIMADPPRNTRRQLVTQLYPQPNTPDYLKSWGVMSLDVKCDQTDYDRFCRLAEALYPSYANDWRHKEVTDFIDSEEFETWASRDPNSDEYDPYYMNKKTSTEMGAANTNAMTDISWGVYALNIANDIGGSFEIATGTIVIFLGLLVEWNPVQAVLGIAVEGLDIHSSVTAWKGQVTGWHDLGFNSIEITAVHENAKVAIHNQGVAIDEQKKQQEATAAALVDAAAANTQRVLDQINKSKKAMIETERDESTDTRTKLNDEVEALRVVSIATIKAVKEYYQSRIAALEQELCALKAQQSLMAEDQNYMRKVILTPEGRRARYNNNPRANPVFPELECVPPLAFFEDTCAGPLDPNGVAAAIRANAPIASCKPV